MSTKEPTANEERQTDCLRRNHDSQNVDRGLPTNLTILDGVDADWSHHHTEAESRAGARRHVGHRGAFAASATAATGITVTLSTV